MLFNWDAIYKKPGTRKILSGMLAVLCLILFTPQTGFCIDALYSFQFEDRWPEASVNNLAYNADRGELYFAAGNFLVVMDAATFTQKYRLPVAIPADNAEDPPVQIARGITGIAADTDRPYVYAACGAQGIAVIDVSDTAEPIVVASLKNITEEDAIHASAVAYLDERLYVADVYFGLRCINVTDPNNPYKDWQYPQPSPYEPEGSQETGGYINVRVASTSQGKRAFVLDRYFGFRVFDIGTKPNTPLASYDMTTQNIWTQSEVVDVAVDWPYAYVTDLTYGVTIIDVPALVNDPEAKHVGQIDTPGTASGLVLSEDGSRLFVADGNSGLLVADLDAGKYDPQNPSYPASLVEGKSYAANSAYAVMAQGGNIYLANAADGLALLENTGGRTYEKAPVSGNPYDPPADTTAVYADAQHAYLLDNEGASEGLRIVSLGQNGQSELNGFVATPGSAQEVAVHDTFAYVADGDQGVAVIDISEKTDPVIAQAPFHPGGNARDVKIRGNSDGSANAYIADSGYGMLRIAEVDESSGTLTPLQSHPITNARAVSVYDQETGGTTRRYASVVNGTTLYVVDVTDPANELPQTLGSLNTSGDAGDVATASLYGKTYAIVADGSQGILLIDISNPASPEQVDAFASEGSAEALALYGSYIHAALGNRGIAVVGITDTEPVELTPIDIDAKKDTESPYYGTPGYASGIFIAERSLNRFTYVADGHGGFWSLQHDDELRSGINEQPFTESPDDKNSIECFISSLF